MEELTNEDYEKIKICFGEMVKNKKSSVDLTLDIKEIENNLKIDVAEVKNYKKGDGTTDTKQVKTNILKEAIEVVQASKKSKLQEKADENINNLTKQVKKQKRKNVWNKILIGVATFTGFYFGTQL